MSLISRQEFADYIGNQTMRRYKAWTDVGGNLVPVLVDPVEVLESGVRRDPYRWFSAAELIDGR